MARKSTRKKPSDEQVARAEKQIVDYAKTVKFTVTEYSFEFIVQKLNSGRYYVPDYQRELVWNSAKKSKFIESAFMGLPIPFVFFWQNVDGRLEIVDGSQRLRTIRDFMADKIKLKGLEVLPALNGFYFSDLSPARRLKFGEIAIRAIILDNSTDAVTRTEMFARINTGGTTANDAEIRRGSLPGPFMDLVIELANDPKFVELTPISPSLIDQREREELVTRFFAYVNSFDADLNDGSGDIPAYREEPRRFFFSFVKRMNEVLALEQEVDQNGDFPAVEAMKNEFRAALSFVDAASPNGFTKSETGKQVPRVRFESIAVGVALALRADGTLVDRVADITPLLNSDEFQEATRSDAANVKSKLLNRITLTRSWLLNQ